MRILHLRRRHHPVASAVRIPDRDPGPPSRGGHGTRRYTRRTGDARSSLARPRRLLLNPKFFRNGIVMLVLVVGTAALLFTWLQSTTQADPDRLFGVPRPTSGRARSTSVVQQGETLTVTPKDPAPARTRVTVPQPVLTKVYPDDMQAAAKAGNVDPRRRHLQGRTGARHVVARPAPDRPAAAARDRRLHLLHDAPGPGHQ